MGELASLCLRLRDPSPADFQAQLCGLLSSLTDPQAQQLADHVLAALAPSRADLLRLPETVPQLAHHLLRFLSTPPSTPHSESVRSLLWLHALRLGRVDLAAQSLAALPALPALPDQQLSQVCAGKVLNTFFIYI